MNRNRALLVGVVVTLHLVFFFLDFGRPASLSRLTKKSIVVRTFAPPPVVSHPLSITQSTETGAPSFKKGQQKKGATRILPTQKKCQPKKGVVPSLERVEAKRRALKRVEEGLKAIQAPACLKDRQDPLPLPFKVSHLAIDRTEWSQSQGYVDLLTCSLKEALALPERGNVKLALTIENSGKVVKLQVLESASDANQAYLESHLLPLSLPPFGKDLTNQNEQTWIVTFCNEN